MKVHLHVISLLFCLLFANLVEAGWQEDLDRLLKTPSGVERDELLNRVLDASPNWQEVVAHIQSLRFPSVETGMFALQWEMCADGVKRPWVLSVPPTYDPGRPTPLMVVLHGGVSRTDLVENPLEYAQKDEFATLGEEHGWLLLYPFGQAGATWWDEVGMAHIRNLVRRVKRKYNVDDDRVWMGGFSDGASASFLHAMVAPSDYAGFVALNGHMGVGSLDGDLPTYAPNFFNAPVYAVTTDRDRLYPSRGMRPTIEMARRAGGKIFYREHEGGHEFAYAAEELPRIARFLERHPRNPFQTEIVWEAAEPRFGLCRWFSIDGITGHEPAQWHRDHNAVLVDSMIIIGFIPDYSHEGAGVKVDRVVDDETALARRADLRAGDVIVKGNNLPISDMDGLNAFKSTVHRGDNVSLTVRRDDQEVVLSGTIPEPKTYYVFKRTQPSAIARVSACANRVEIVASRLKALRILVHPDMFRLEQNLVIQVNGRVVYDGPVRPDVRYLIENFIENYDRNLMYVAEVAIEL